MPRRSAVDWNAVAWSAPHNILSLHELEALGVPIRTVANRCGRAGAWTRLLPGVVMLGGGTPTWHQLLDAALRYAGPRAVLTGAAGIRLHGLRRGPQSDEVHILIPEREQRATHSMAVIERTIRMPVAVRRSGFPVAPAARSVMDCVRRLRDVDRVRAVIAESVQAGLVTTSGLTEELRLSPKRGTALPRLVLQEVSAGVRSTAEAWGRSLVSSSGLPTARWNVDIHDERGAFLARPDAWFDDVALAWEIDSYEFHLSPADYARTLARHAAMTAAGIVVVHTLPSRVRTEPAAVLSELQGAYRLAAARSRPPVSARPDPSPHSAST
jgi:hypothetical protein